MCDAWFSCIFRFTRSARARAASSCCLRATSCSPSIAAHWNGVCGLGTWVDTDAVTCAPRW